MGWIGAEDAVIMVVGANDPLPPSSRTWSEYVPGDGLSITSVGSAADKPSLCAGGVTLGVDEQQRRGGVPTAWAVATKSSPRNYSELIGDSGAPWAWGKGADSIVVSSSRS